MRAHLAAGFLAFVENLRRGFDHKSRALQCRRNRYQNGEAILPSSVALERAVDSKAVATNRLDLPYIREEKLRHRPLHFAYFPPRMAREYRGTLRTVGNLNSAFRKTFRFRAAPLVRIETRAQRNSGSSYCFARKTTDAIHISAPITAAIKHTTIRNIHHALIGFPL